ncbi:MAG: ATP-dependent DNA helicase RecG [Clostridia bacterium]|nr:ATP-dependent DNA helicase RecG [Clostridia bacterium]
MRQNGTSPGFDAPLTSLPGVGSKRAELFARLGAKTVGGLLDHFPRAYQNRGNVRSLPDCDPDMACSCVLTVSTVPRSARVRGMVMTKFTAVDDDGRRATIYFFNNRFIEKTFEVGQRWRFWCRVKRDRSGFVLSAPIHERADGPVPPPALVPVYPLTAGLNSNIVMRSVADALSLVDKDTIPEPVPEELRRRENVPTAAEAYHMIHSPRSMDEVERARRYFALRDAVVFSVSLGVHRRMIKKGTPPVMKPVSVAPLVSLLGFELTEAQKRSVREISADMTSGTVPMTRLLSGDVGSGKTAVAAAAAYIALKNGWQVGLMAPTDILARQHFSKLEPLFTQLGFGVALLTGSMKESEKAAVRAGLANGRIKMAVGTHALLTDSTVFMKPGLMIADEQHRFGVSQRAVFGGAREGTTPHMLVMSATPIPRTMGLVMFGDLSLSTLDELPPGRKPVRTFAVDSSYTKRLVEFIKKQVRAGGRVYVVCPTIDKQWETEDLVGGSDPETESHARLCSANETMMFLNFRYIGTGIKVGIIHGKMKNSEKDLEMTDFAEGRTQVLVSTTVVEVGVDVPEATLMIVLNAECFGLAQLHQLRGRVGRGSAESYCVLVSDSEGEAAKERLGVMVKTNDGFAIAEADLNQRGPGDYLPRPDGSVRQHGEFAGVMSADMSMLKHALDYSAALLERDPMLDTAPELRAAAEKLYAENRRALQ